MRSKGVICRCVDISGVNFNYDLEQRSLVIELEVCGDIHKRLIIGERPLAYKYREGKMKRTLEIELKSMRKCWQKADQFNGRFFEEMTSKLYSAYRYNL